MSSLISNATIQIRRDTASNWTSNNPTPADGEWCKETDTGFFKNGDGSTVWTSLDYQPNPAEVDAKPTGTTAQLCKAWVNFDGTTNTAGKCTIRSSYNVTDVDDDGVGIYTINYTNAMPDANYAVSGIKKDFGSVLDGHVNLFSVATGSVTIRTIENGAETDSTIICIQVFSL